MTNSISLYKITNELQSLFSQLYDHETGEVNMEVDAKINELTSSGEKKCIGVANWIKSMEAEKKEIEFYKSEILKREHAYNTAIEKAEGYLKSNMERANITEVKCPYFKLRIKKNPFSTDILDESQIPEKFMNKREVVKIEIKPDKNAIKEEVLKTGVQVPGTSVQQKTKLEIITDKY